MARFIQETIMVLKKIIHTPPLHILILGALLFGVFLLLVEKRNEKPFMV